jgi:serine protease AprX
LQYATPAVGGAIAHSNGWTGNGIGIAIIDSGVSPDNDLKDSVTGQSRIVFSQGFYPGGKTVDAYGHGTPVASAAAGNGAGSAGKYTGMATRAKIINLRVLSDNGVGQDSYVIAAIDRAIQLKAQYNIRVINLSLGRPVYESYAQDPLCQAAERAWKAGIVVVAAAGNEGRNNTVGTNGYGTISSPGNHPLVITVGAMRDMGTLSRYDDVMASYSSKGPSLIDHIVKPDILAPGNRIVAAQGSGTHKLAQLYPGNKVTGTYFRLSGTSLAAPLVSGAAALMLEKEPALTPDQVKARLMLTATKVFPTYSTAFDPVSHQNFTIQSDLFTVGAGYLDVWAALNNTTLAPTTLAAAASPTAVLNPATNAVTVVNTNSAVWGVSAVWGSSAVWGNSAVWGVSTWVDGSSAVWGVSAVWGSSAVWGVSETSGFSAVWGSSAVWGVTTTTASETASLLINGDQ